MRRRPAVFALVLAFVLGGAAPVRATPDTSLADWVVSAQLSDGAVKQWVDTEYWAWRVNPYWANYASIGLARTYAATGIPLYAQKSWAWLHWYELKQRNRPAPYYVNDYMYTSTDPASAYDTGKRDSTDAYAATYLLALWETYKATGNTAELASFLVSIARAIAAIESTQDADGLTIALPGGPFKYLMDNVEVYAGLVAASELAGTLGDTVTQQRALSDVTRVAAGIEQLWNVAGGYYHWAKEPGVTGTLHPTSWAMFDPDSVAQAWAVALGNWFTKPAFNAVPAARATAIMNQFAARWPQWAVTSVSGYHPLIGTAFLAVGRNVDAANAAVSIRAGADGAQRAWPFTTGNAGQLALLEVVT